MELVDQLEEKFSKLLNNIKELKEDNQRLREELEAERAKKRDIENRIDTLLAKIQDELE